VTFLMQLTLMSRSGSTWKDLQIIKCDIKRTSKTNDKSRRWSHAFRWKRWVSPRGWLISSILHDL